MNHSLVRPAVVCLAAILLAPVAHAQQTPARTSPPQAGAAAPATPPALATSHLAVANEFINLTGVSKLYDPIVPQFSAQIRQRAVTRPELGKDLDQVLEILKPELEHQKQLMVDATAKFYASAFSEAELKELIAFAKTPVGNKYFQLSPKIRDQLDLETRRWAERVAEFAITRVRAELGKRGHQF